MNEPEIKEAFAPQGTGTPADAPQTAAAPAEKPADESADKPQTADKPVKKPKPEAAAKKPKKGAQKKPPVKKRPPQKKPKSDGQLFLKLLIKLAVIVLAVWAVLSFVLCVNVHYGNNMHPAVRDGDLVVTYRLQNPFINAVVLYEHNGKTTVGRVIALSGDVVSITENGALTVNGIVPNEEVYSATMPASGSTVTYPYRVPDGSVFILNDFRDDTLDSRAFGAVHVEDLKGCALFTMRRREF